MDCLGLSPPRFPAARGWKGSDSPPCRFRRMLGGRCHQREEDRRQSIRRHEASSSLGGLQTWSTSRDWRGKDREWGLQAREKRKGESTANQVWRMTFAGAPFMRDSPWVPEDARHVAWRLQGPASAKPGHCLFISQRLGPKVDPWGRNVWFKMGLYLFPLVLMVRLQS